MMIVQTTLHQLLYTTGDQPENVEACRPSACAKEISKGCSPRARAGAASVASSTGRRENKSARLGNKAAAETGPPRDSREAARQTRAQAGLERV